MTERNRGGSRESVCRSLRENVNAIVDASADVKLLSAWVPYQATKCVRDRQRLHLARRIRRDVVNENVFGEALGALAIVAASEQQQRPAVWTERRRDGLTERHVATTSHAGI